MRELKKRERIESEREREKREESLLKRARMMRELRGAGERNEKGVKECVLC